MTCFEYGIAVQGNQFYGRQEEIQTVLEHGRTWICGQRRMGKSSLLVRIGEELRLRDWIVLESDIARVRPADATGEILFHSIFRRHYKTLRHEGVGRDQFNGYKPEEAFGALIEHLFDSGKKVAFLWDEAERLIDVNNNDLDFFDAFRAHLGQNKDFKLVIAGTQRLSELYPDDEKVSSFLSTFKFMPLKGLEDPVARSLINCDQTDGWTSGLPFDIITEIIDWCGGHPLLLQELGDKLARSTNGHGARVTKEVLNQQRRSIIGNEALRNIFANDQRLLPPLQQCVLRSVCLSRSPLMIDALIQSTGLDEKQLTPAVVLLDNFGYIRWKNRISLRFNFYPAFLIPDQVDSLTNERKIAKVQQPLPGSHPEKRSVQAVSSWDNLFNVFLSHNGNDKPIVMELGKKLKKRGLHVWLDAWELVPGRPWQPPIEEIIKTAHSAVVCIGRDGIGPWEDVEMRACLSEFVARNLPVIPALLPNACKEPELPLFLKGFTWVDLRDGINDESLDLLQWGVTGVKPGISR